jgi:hypothetical protein
MVARGTVVSAALALAGVAACMGPNESLTPQVKGYIQQLPKSSSGAPQAAVGVTQYFARKDTLQVNGNLIVGNWNLGAADDVCLDHQGTMALILTSIDHFDDLTPCPDGKSNLVRAVMK